MKIEVTVLWVVTPCSDVVNTLRRWRQRGPPKRWHHTISPHGVITQKIAISMISVKWLRTGYP